MWRFWSILFLLVPVLGVALFAVAMTNSWPIPGHWLPKDISEHGHVIDGLFDFILYLTGVVFVGTGLALFWFLWKYNASVNSAPVKFIHGSHTLEVVWSILPAATLLFIAIYQMDAWAGVKVMRPDLLPGADGIVGTADDCAMVEVLARQFEWRIRYPGPDQILRTPDDLLTVNDLHVPVNQEVVIALKSDDVLHSFFLPNVRIKQDAVPGMKQYVWFKPLDVGKFDLVCAELCGWGHYKMKGQLVVQSQDEFQGWLKDLEREQNLDEFAAGEVAEDDE